jgi:hypothetical protein
MFLRDTAGSIVGLDGKEVNATGCVGHLIYGGGTAFASASNPAAEVLDGTGVVAGSNLFGVAADVAAGTLTVARGGDYEIELNLADFSCGAASGNVQFDVYVNAAAIASTNRMQAIRVAATAKGGLSIQKVQRLAAGDAVSVVVTSAAGNAITVTEGSLLVKQLKDRLPLTNIG